MPPSRREPSSFAPALRALRATLACAAMGCVLLFVSPSARAQTPELPSKKPYAQPTYVRAFATLGGGIGLRFNNPYRLEHQLGNDANGLSSTAPYTDLGVGATFGDPFAWQHGATLRWDRAITGVSQSVITPSYVALRRWVRGEAWGRVGVPIVVSPDVTGGGELAIGGAWFFTAGVGVGGEMIGDLFFGAATPEKKNPSYPVLSWQLNVVVEWERLP